MSTPTWQDVAEARRRVRPHVHRTPVFSSRTFDDWAGGRVFFKCENLQRTGSFKIRGACNAIAALSSEDRRRGIITHSSGNHAQAVALAARLHGCRATIVMPEDAPLVKRQATAAYGASIELCGLTHEARYSTALRLVEETGGVLIDSHDDPMVIAGQGTAVAELIEEVGPVDIVLAPVGGGGLLSGTAIAAAELSPGARVIGCEPSGADDAFRSFRGGERIIDFTPDTIAEGLRTPLGVLNFEIIRRQVDDILRVPEEEIPAAMRAVWERMKLVIETSSAVAVAPLLHGMLRLDGERVGVILSGGNVDFERLSEFMNPGIGRAER